MPQRGDTADYAAFPWWAFPPDNPKRRCQHPRCLQLPVQIPTTNTQKAPLKAHVPLQSTGPKLAYCSSQSDFFIGWIPLVGVVGDILELVGAIIVILGRPACGREHARIGRSTVI